MRTEILCLTHGKDMALLQAGLLPSIERFATGFQAVRVVVPDHERMLFANALPGWVKLGSYPEVRGKGMVQHEGEICRADHWCNEADAVLHMDADTMFVSPVSPASYFHEGKPILWRERFERFRLSHQNRYGWKAAVLAACGIDPEWETMCRHPAVHLRRTYGLTRAAVEQHTGKAFMEYVLSCRNEYPQTFAEFPALGAVAIALTPEQYHFINIESDVPNPCEHVIQFWSHGGLDFVHHAGDKSTRERIADILNA